MQPEHTDLVTQDFNRDVYCLFGLPVDNLTLEATKVLLRAKSGQEGNAVLSTINVNWVVQSLTDPAFRAAILNSEMVTLDGKPLLWLAKLLGYPMTEVVAGSTLIHELNQEQNPEKSLSIFFFGGEEGAGGVAQEQVNKRKGGLNGVGFLNPGFGTVEEMSSEAIIQAINKTVPDILLVALGAGKGTRWIEHNRNRLNAKIISHLGATINFLAGTVQRAPRLASKCGLEWAWRILQEPKLFSRYALDGFAMLRFLAGRLLLWLKFLAWQKHYLRENADTEVEYQESDQQITLSFGRNLRGAQGSPLRAIFIKCASSDKDLLLDFEETKFADGAFLGLLLLLIKHQQRQARKLTLANVHGILADVFLFFGIPHKLMDE